ncbi:MAG: DNA translocase FtsK [Armatimonadetes bacterium]|nr:DNA translocase FtsK [Armatimonadota bacterium]
MNRTRRKIQNDSLMQDIAGIACITFGGILFVGIVAPQSGLLGGALGVGARMVVGLGAYVVPFLFIIAGGVLVTGAPRSATTTRLIGFFLLFLVFVTWSQFARTASVTALFSQPRIDPLDVQLGGGYLGLGMGYLLELILGRISSHIFLTAVLIISLVLITGVPFMMLVALPVAGIRLLFSGRGKLRGFDVRRPVELERNGSEKKERPKVLTILKKPVVVNGEKSDVVTGAVVTGKIDRGQSAAAQLPRESNAEFQLPPVTLLNEPPPPPKRIQSELNYKIDVIERTLEEFKIEADVVEVCHGPTVTRYEIQLAPGIKVNKIVSLADNLAMALAAIDVRVEAPIPGKSAIGVEVPNSNPGIVTLREVIDNEEFWNAPSKLTFALGKDIAGEPKFADLAKMPHMLIAGATNAGKSVCLNSMIASLLFRATPKEVKFILIDPKRVELSLFDGIPHLCTPVVRDIRQAAGILRATLKEMERRYDLFVQMGTRNFDGYNAKAKPEERLPYLVLIIDELADLMMQAGPEVEFAICRLAQLARATGIHLVIATQRPSVDVVTGTIKANISSRVAFAVNSQVDSRTILDMGGAERLIGRGDMLFKPVDAAKPVRIQGCLITEREIESLVKFLKDQGSPVYTMEPAQITDVAGAADDGVKDEFYEPAVRLVVTQGYASTSMIQRRFKIGYTRAARIVDAMETQGIVGPPDGARPREVLITAEDLDRVLGGATFGEETNNFDEEDN